MPRKKRGPKPPDLEQQRGSERYREQVRKLSQALPDPSAADERPDDDVPDVRNRARGFSETDADERSDTPRRVGPLPRGTGASQDQAEFDEDGGGPRQAASPYEGGPPAREDDKRIDDMALLAETGAGRTDQPVEEPTVAEEIEKQTTAEVEAQPRRGRGTTVKDTGGTKKGRKQARVGRAGKTTPTRGTPRKSGKAPRGGR